jgi:hypothetical protein
LVFLIGSCQISPEGLAARTYEGARQFIAWEDVASVRISQARGMPALVVIPKSSGKGVWIYTLGANRPEIYEHLCRCAGSEHVLTRCFEPKVTMRRLPKNSDGGDSSCDSP